jgi:iron complex outermembrane receptor protein
MARWDYKWLPFLFFLLPLSIHAQEQRIRNSLSGQVVDAATRSGIPGASVYIHDQKRGTVCDEAGHFHISNLAPGNHLVEVSHVGYGTITENLIVNGDVIRNFSLSHAILENNEVIITGVSAATQIRRSPAPVSIIRRTELVRTVSTNLVDALSRKPGVSQLSTGPAVSKPFIRGLGYNRILIINDGVRQEGQQWGDEHGIEVDEYSVSKVEILKGPASLMYGSDALGGVINIITHVPVTEGTIKGNLISNYQTNNKLRGVGGNIGGNKNGFNWNLFGTYKAAADYTNQYDGRVFNSKFTEKNAGGYIGYNGRWGFTHLLFSSFHQQSGLIEGDRDSTGAFVKTLGGGIITKVMPDDFNYIHPMIPYQDIQHRRLAIDNNFNTGSGNIALNVGFQQNKRKEFGDADIPDQFDLFFDLTTITYQSIYHFNMNKGWKTSAGISGMHQENLNKGSEVLIPEYRLTDAGAFLFAQKTGEKFSLSGGVRYDARRLNSLAHIENNQLKFESFTRNFSNISGSIGFSYSFSSSFLIKFNAARGFRAPSIPELASNGAHEGTRRYEYGNPRLQSETSLQFDAGIEANSEHISVAATFFRNSIDNFIFYRKLKTTGGNDSMVLHDNELLPAFAFGQNHAVLAGGEITVDIHPHPFDWLHFENSFSFVRGKFSSPVEGISNLPLIPAPRFLSELRAVVLGKGKVLNNFTLKFELEKTFRQQYAFTAFDTETETPGYTLLNAGIQADVVKKDKSLISVYISVMNMADVAYQNHLSRLKYQGENLYTGRQGVFNSGRNFSFKIFVPFAHTFKK